MKRFRSLFIATLGMGLAVSSFAFDALSDFKAFLKKSEASTAKAFANKDASYFEKVTTPDFTYTSFNGPKMNKKQAIAQMKAQLSTAQSIKARFKSSNVALRGNTATVDTINYFDMKISGPDGKPHAMKLTSYSKETYRKVGAKWLLALIVETKAGKMTMDGKPFDPSAMGGPPPAR